MTREDTSTSPFFFQLSCCSSDSEMLSARLNTFNDSMEKKSQKIIALFCPMSIQTLLLPFHFHHRKMCFKLVFINNKTGSCSFQCHQNLHLHLLALMLAIFQLPLFVFLAIVLFCASFAHLQLLLTHQIWSPTVVNVRGCVCWWARWACWMLTVLNAVHSTWYLSFISC